MNLQKKVFFANYEISENSWFDDVQKINGTKFKDKIDLYWSAGHPASHFRW